LVASTGQPGISWTWHEPVHSKPGHVSVVFSFVACLRAD
jgi:hypothetical protein